MVAEQQLATLLVATAHGDRAAFKELYEATAPRLLGAGVRLLRRRELAEDALQEVFVKVWHRANEYRAERGSALSWLHTIMRNEALDRLRARRPTFALDDEVASTLAFEGAGPLDEAASDDMAQRVRRCLEGLPETQRRSISLAFFEGFSHSELTAALATPLGTVKSWIRRGLMGLQRCLEA
jgi:RNA polymerase sigma-70 factor, ECF subfamily